MARSLGSGYVLHESLGRGAMGQVFAGQIRQTGLPVAVKILRPELISDPDVVARFVQERTILMSVADPHVVRVVDLVIEGETLAIVMELVKGPDLRAHLRERRTLRPAEAVRLTGQLLRGAAAVHAAGIVHRDIKPENLMLDLSGRQPVLKLTDFGVARLSYGASLTKLSGLIGTPEYMAPELAEHNRATPAADVYSAGIVLYELLCGQTPFAGGHPLAVLRRHVDQAPPPIPGVPAELWERIAWMLAKDPRSRPAAAEEALATLAPLESSLASLAALPPWAPEDHEDHGANADGTVLRYRDRVGSGAGGLAGEDQRAGRAGGPAGRPALLASFRQAPRRKRQAALAAATVGLAAVIALVTTVAMAATHRPASSRPAAAQRTTAAPVTTSPATTRPASSSATTAGPGTLPPTTALDSQPPSVAASSAAGQTAAGQPATGPAVTPSTAATTPAVAQSSASATPSLSTAEQQLADMLNSGILSYCAARPQSEGGIIAAAVNCAYQDTGPTKNPLAESIVPGYASTWFNNHTVGFASGNDCVNGKYLGVWYHHGATAGQLGCTTESNGLLLLVWVVNNQVGIIAEGSDHQALYKWWSSRACLLAAACAGS